MASSTKLGAWRWTSVRVQRTGRRTHHVHPITSLVMNRCRAARVGNFGRSRENLRDMAHRALSRAERMLSSAGRGRRRKAPSISPSSAPALPAVLHAHHAALRRAQCRRTATGAAVWPRQGPPPPYRSAGGRPTPRCGGSSRTSPTLAPRLPAPTPRPVGTHRRPPSRRTGRSYRPLPLQRGAPQRHHRRPSPVISPAIAGRSRHRVSPLVIERGKILNGGVLIERGTQAEVP